MCAQVDAARYGMELLDKSQRHIAKLRSCIDDIDRRGPADAATVRTGDARLPGTPRRHCRPRSSLFALRTLPSTRLCGEASALVENHDKIRALSLAHINVSGGWREGLAGGRGRMRFARGTRTWRALQCSKRYESKTSW